MRVDAKSSFFADVEQFFLSLPDLYSVVSNFLSLVSPESYRVSYPVTDSSGERLYLEMHTADWWWNMQV